jgi:hypothetical protein
VRRVRTEGDLGRVLRAYRVDVLER